VFGSGTRAPAHVSGMLAMNVKFPHLTPKRRKRQRPGVRAPWRGGHRRRQLVHFDPCRLAHGASRAPRSDVRHTWTAPGGRARGDGPTSRWRRHAWQNRSLLSDGANGGTDLIKLSQAFFLPGRRAASFRRAGLGRQTTTNPDIHARRRAMARWVVARWEQALSASDQQQHHQSAVSRQRAAQHRSAPVYLVKGLRRSHFRRGRRG